MCDPSTKCKRHIKLYCVVITLGQQKQTNILLPKNRLLLRKVKWHSPRIVKQHTALQEVLPVRPRKQSLHLLLHHPVTLIKTDGKQMYLENYHCDTSPRQRTKEICSGNTLW